VSSEPSLALQARVAGILGWTPSTWRRVRGGYTAAARYVAALGGERCFVKIATTAVTAAMLRREAHAYTVIEGAFVPTFIGWDDDPAEPLLIIEDLSEATWPPPWTPGLVEQVHGQIAAMHRCAPRLPPMSELIPDMLGGWSRVAEDPRPFLSLQMANVRWLRSALPHLVTAEAACRTDGSVLTHFDLRSDNICITAAGPKFIDWAEACLGNPALDLGGWLPSLELEGGPPPDTLLPDEPEVAAWVSGYFAARAGLPPVPDAPRVRAIQTAQLTTALPWARRALGLAPLS
jgi:hypothetical protein